MGKSWCDKSDEGKIVILQRTLKTFRFLWSEGRPVFDTGIQGTLFQANEPGYGRFIEQGGAAVSHVHAGDVVGPSAMQPGSWGTVAMKEASSSLHSMLIV